MESSQLATKRPWELPWWKSSPGNTGTLWYLGAIHLVAFVGFILFPIPGWKIFLTDVAIIALGGLGTSLCYHRSLAHRSVVLNVVVEQFLVFWAVFNGSGTPRTWIANHRNHHANADTIDDVSSPRHGGFWWAHLRWVYQWETSNIEKWAPDMMKTRYLFWSNLQPLILVISIFSGYFIAGWKGFFWIGAIRLVYILHMQMFVNSLLHLKPGLPEGVDSSRNIWWLGPLQVAAWGENWHGNHHADPAIAPFGRVWWQVDVPWYVIRILRACRLASKVRVLQV